MSLTSDDEVECMSRDEMRTIVSEAVTYNYFPSAIIKLEQFSGDGGYDIISWLKKFDGVADANRWDDAARLRRVKLYLKGPALDWYELNIDGNPDAPTWWASKSNTEPGVRNLLRKFAIPTDFLEHLKRAMKDKHQAENESVKYYMVKKRLLCKRLIDNGYPMTEEKIMKEIYRGMKPEIEMQIRTANPKNTDELAKVAERIERSYADVEKKQVSSITKKGSDQLVAKMTEVFGKLMRERSRERPKREEYATNSGFNRDRDDGKRITEYRKESYGFYKDRPKYREDNNNDGNRYRPRETESREIRSEGRAGNHQDKYRGKSFETDSRRHERKWFENEDRTFDGKRRCFYCHKLNHVASQCFQNPNSRNYRGSSRDFKPRVQERTYESARQRSASPYIRHRSESRESEHSNRSVESNQGGMPKGPVRFSSVVLDKNKLPEVKDTKLGEDTYYYVRVFFDDIMVEAFFDSGSTCTIIRPEVARQLKKEIKPYTGGGLKGCNESPLEIFGETEFKISFVDESGALRSIQLPAVVATIHNSVILGNNFSRKAGAMLDCETGAVWFKSISAPVVNNSHKVDPSSSEESEDDEPRQLHCSFTTEVPPRSSCFVPAKIAGNPKWLAPAVVSQGKSYNRKTAITANAIVNVQDGICFSELLNVTNAPIVVNSGTVIGVCEVLKITDLDENKVVNYGHRETKEKAEIIPPEDPTEELKLKGGHILVNAKLKASEKKQIQQCLNDYVDIMSFDGRKLGCCDTLEFRTEVTNRPMARAPYRYSYTKRKQLNDIIQDLLDRGIVQQAESDCALPVILVPKKDGTARLCHDLRALNAETVKKVYPMPKIEDVLGAFEGSVLFSCIDLNEAYHQLRIHPDDQSLFTMITQDGSYMWKRMPFGATLAPFAYQKLMDIVLSGLKYSSAYLKSKKELPPRLMRWAMEMQGLDYTIVHRPGHTMKDADALSRHPVGPAVEMPDFADRLVTSVFAIPTPSDLIELQATDHFCKDVIRRMTENSESELHRDYSIRDKILYKVIEVKSQPKLVVVAPKKLRGDILHAVHDDVLGGHLGVRKTLDKVQRRFYFPKMTDYINKYVRSCNACQHRKHSTLKKARLLQPIAVGGAFETVGCDLLGPFVKTDAGNKHVIVATDYLTKFVITKAVPNGSAQEVARFFLEEIVCRHGCPSKIITDKGKAFLAEVSRCAYEMMGTKLAHSSGFHPETNGLVERNNRTIGVMLSMYTNSRHTDWDRALPFITFAINSAPQDTTGYTPFFLTHGREPVLPLEAALGAVTLGTPDAITYINSVAKYVKEARNLAALAIKSAQANYSKRYNMSHRALTFEPGDKVLVFTPRRIVGRSEKLLSRFYGPYKVVEMASPVVVEVQPLVPAKGLAEQRVHISRCKKYYDRNDIMSRDSTDFDAVPASEQPTLVIPLTQQERVAMEEVDTFDELIEEPQNEQLLNIEDPNETGYSIEFQPETTVPADGRVAVDQQLRRSTRAKRKPDRLAYSIWSTLLLTSFTVGDIAYHFSGYNIHHTILFEPEWSPNVNNLLMSDLPRADFTSIGNEINTIENVQQLSFKLFTVMELLAALLTVTVAIVILHFVLKHFGNRNDVYSTHSIELNMATCRRELPAIPAPVALNSTQDIYAEPKRV
ncbi:Retrovirus-related Pol polyprotein from transposon [Halotydeus destructor]|nr:Retrovirus-related Pol polyprotein from transposon [Halotydeus destructor]